MFFTAKSLFFLAAAFTTAIAQSSTATGSASAPAPSSTAGLDACVITCSTQAITSSNSGCTSIADLACVCNSASFQAAALACLKANCTSADVTSATQLQSAECAAFVSSGSGSATSSGGSSTATSGTQTSATSGTLTGTGQSTSSTSKQSATSSTGSSSSSSGTTSSSSSSSAAGKVTFGYSGLLGSAVGLVGIVIGTLVVA